MLIRARMRIEDRPSFFFFISIILLLLSPAVSFADADRIFKENSQAVVVVVAYDAKGEAISQGSGFIVRPDGAVATNYHVISKARDIKVKVGDKVLKVEGILHADKENDLVILKAEGGGLPIVKLGSISEAAVGEKVYVISSPQGLENTISDGILSGIREISPGRKILQMTAPVSGGSSGGPVFNQNGEVIGVVTFLIKEAQNLNFAMPVDMIKDKISAEKVAPLKDYELEDYEKTAEFWFYLGFLYGESGRYQEAIEAYRQAIRIKPDDAEAHYNLGLAYGKSGRYQEAIEAFRQAIRIRPDDAEAYYNLGLEYLRMKDRGSALEEYKILKALDPERANKLFNLIYK